VSTPVPPSPSGGSRGEVKTQSLNVRSGPGTTYDVILTATQGTVFTVLDVQSDWIKVRVGMGTGYVAAQYVDLTTTRPSTGFLIEQTDLLSAPLPASRVIPAQPSNASANVVARTWNNFGGLVGTLSARLNVPVNSMVCRAVCRKYRQLLRAGWPPDHPFENHIFYQYWGQKNPDMFNRYFAFDTSAPANAWRGHLWRKDENSPWVSFHGNQDLEWQVLIVAARLTIRRPYRV